MYENLEPKAVDLFASTENPEAAAGVAVASIGISLKRIADSLEAMMSEVQGRPRPDDQPSINVKSEVTADGLTGTTYHRVSRVEREDDGSFTAVIGGG